MPILPEKYRRLYDDLADEIGRSRLITDHLGTLALGTDASFYRRIPKIVVKAETEAEVVATLKAADRAGTPVTFRAAGTSLSGQAVSDSVLLVAGGAWRDYEILEGGGRIRLQPGVIGGHANRSLAPLGRKIGPDPASINAAMIGGIAANNASGMCCGTAQNSYRTVAGLKIIFADGTILNTADPESRSAFRESHGDMLAHIAAMARSVAAAPALADRIRRKFKIKNTTGYSLNALVDFTDPFDIIAHLMIGSEGTLGFISEVIYDTVIDHPHKATALMIFPDIATACRAAAILRKTPVSAVELMDRPALRSVEGKPGMPDFLDILPDGAAALLTESRAADAPTLENRISAIHTALDSLKTVFPIEFTDRVDEYTKLWNIRKGLFPAVGAVRRIGTTVVIEDVAFPIDRLADATLDLRDLLNRRGYGEAIIFGHALEGNLHFVFTQDFALPPEVRRYRDFMADLCDLVVNRHDGSLKAEHGTGRNMAPFVEMEWGREAYDLMGRIKGTFDPRHLLNPGVILNPDPEAHLKDLKPLPPTHPLVDKCIECGFCEVKCPSRNLTLTPRQRIVICRETSRLEATGEEPARLRDLRSDYGYPGEATCAADGLCATACPVGIDTGALTKFLRSLKNNPAQKKWADRTAQRFADAARTVRTTLKSADAFHGLVGTAAMTRATMGARKISGDRLPLWNRFMPRGVEGPRPHDNGDPGDLCVVYFPSCVARTMGPGRGDPDGEPLPRVTERVLKRAGYSVIYPENMDDLCCGTPFETKGFAGQADRKSRELERALLIASADGAHPILCETSPCLFRMRKVMSRRLRLFEPGEFTADFLMDRLDFRKLPETVALHMTCSTTKMGVEGKLLRVAGACAETVVVPEKVGCCGFAGDRGFSHPELNAAALADLGSAVSGCAAGYSNSRTCEIGLSLHSGIYYKSILYLVDRCTRPRAVKR